MKHSTIFTTSRLFHRKLRSVISMGAAAVLMVAGVSLMATSSAGAVGTGTTTVTTSAGPSSPQIMGTSVTISAAISNPVPSGTPGGTVDFEYSTGAGYSSVTACSAVTVAGGAASCVTTALPAGTVSLESVYSGDGTYALSPSAAIAYSVTGNTVSTTSLGANPVSAQVYQNNVLFTATVTTSATGSVNFLSATSVGGPYVNIGGCTGIAVTGSYTAPCTTAALPIGANYIEAVYLGNTTYAPSTSSPYPYSITPGAGSVLVALSATPTSPVSAGSTVTMTATVTGTSPVGTPAGGTMTFQYSSGAGYLTVPGCTNPATATNGLATCVTTTLPYGTVSLQAVYSGNATYNTGTSPAIAYFVRTTSVTTLGALPGSPITYGGTVTFTSTVTAGTTGTVNFESSLNDIAFTSITGCGAEVLSVSSVATCVTNALPTGLDYVEAVYSGNTTYAPSTSAALNYTVTAAGQAAITVTPIAGVVGVALTLVANGGSGAGAVTFSAVNGTATGCTVTGTSIKVTTAGTCLVTATKAADANYIAANSAATTVTFVNPIPKAIRVIGAPLVGKTTVIGIAGQYFYGQPSIITNVGGVTAKVSKDTGSLLTVQVTVKSGVRQGIYVFALTFKNGQRTNVKYNLR